MGRYLHRQTAQVRGNVPPRKRLNYQFEVFACSEQTVESLSSWRDTSRHSRHNCLRTVFVEPLSECSASKRRHPIVSGTGNWKTRLNILGSFDLVLESFFVLTVVLCKLKMTPCTWTGGDRKCKLVDVKFLAPHISDKRCDLLNKTGKFFFNLKVGDGSIK